MKLAAYMHIVLALTLFGQAAQAQEDDRIYYGSRVGMHLTTVSKKGIGTANAVIFVKHTPKDAKAFCAEYERDNSMACVKNTMAAVKVGDRVTANCIKRTWTDMSGKSFKFLGPVKRPSEMVAEYLVRDLQSGEILDGSTASGYWVEMVIFGQLCPGITKWVP